MTINPGLRYSLALFAGALTPLSFSPVNWWPLSVATVGLFYWCLLNVESRVAGKLGFVFGCGFFGVGASWIYVSIHDYSDAPALVALVITSGFVVILASYLAVQSWLWRRFLSQHWPALSFAAVWVLAEAWRGWFLTGFPWLYLGYAHVTSPFSGVAPILGVQGLSFLVALTGAVLVQLLVDWRSLEVSTRVRRMGVLALVLVSSLATYPMHWTRAMQHPPLSVGLVQGDIPQEEKFADIQAGLTRYAELTAPLWQNDIVVWPETAIPLIYQEQPDLLATLDAQAHSKGTALLTGIFYRSDHGVHNSIVALGTGSGIWHKQKLVPFGEYVPLRDLLSNLLELFSLPLSSVTPGPAEQHLLQVQNLSIAPFICYEVVYPDFVRKTGANAALLLTISNDTWFGASFGPPQHLQMAAMRARELGRYMIRATNNGISAIIAPSGEIISQTAQFEATTLQDSVLAYDGQTPFARAGSWPIWILSLALIVANLTLVWKTQSKIH